MLNYGIFRGRDLICRSTGDEYTGCLYAGIVRAAAQGEMVTLINMDTGEILAMTKVGRD